MVELLIGRVSVEHLIHTLCTKHYYCYCVRMCLLSIVSVSVSLALLFCLSTTSVRQDPRMDPSGRQASATSQIDALRIVVVVVVAMRGHSHDWLSSERQEETDDMLTSRPSFSGTITLAMS